MTDERSIEGQHLPFNEGLPTKPDVDLLVRTWPDPKLGDRFDYEAVERILGLSRDSARFRTVCAAWRNRMMDSKNVVIECDPGVAFYVLNADEVAARTYGMMQFVGRKARKHRKKLATVKWETEQQRVLVEHHGRYALALEHDAKKHRMNLIPSTATKPQPQIAPPKESKAS